MCPPSEPWGLNRPLGPRAWLPWRGPGAGDFAAGHPGPEPSDPRGQVPLASGARLFYPLAPVLLAEEGGQSRSGLPLLENQHVSRCPEGFGSSPSLNHTPPSVIRPWRWLFFAAVASSSALGAAGGERPLTTATA